jgi:hypothetical protein
LDQRVIFQQDLEVLEPADDPDVPAADRPQEGTVREKRENLPLASLGLTNFRYSGRSGLSHWRLVIKNRREAVFAKSYIPPRLTGMSSNVECN